MMKSMEDMGKTSEEMIAFQPMQVSASQDDLFDEQQSLDTLACWKKIGLAVVGILYVIFGLIATLSSVMAVMMFDNGATLAVVIAFFFIILEGPIFLACAGILIHAACCSTSGRRHYCRPIIGRDIAVYWFIVLPWIPSFFFAILSFLPGS